MGQTQSDVGALFTGKITGYDTIPTQKTKILVIFDHSIEAVSFVVPKIVNTLSDIYEVSVAIYSPAGLKLGATKYRNLKQTMDSVDHLVFFSVSVGTQNPFSSKGCFEGLFKYLRGLYPEYRRYGYFALGMLCQDFNGSENNPLNLIYDGDSVEVRNTGSPLDVRRILANAYKDRDRVSEVEDYWWVRTFTCKFTRDRFYFGGEWIDEDTILAQVKKSLGDLAQNPLW